MAVWAEIIWNLQSLFFRSLNESKIREPVLSARQNNEKAVLGCVLFNVDFYRGQSLARKIGYLRHVISLRQFTGNRLIAG